jgi:hypothetical protein
MRREEYFRVAFIGSTTGGCLPVLQLVIRRATYFKMRACQEPNHDESSKPDVEVGTNEEDNETLKRPNRGKSVFTHSPVTRSFCDQDRHLVA